MTAPIAQYILRALAQNFTINKILDYLVKNDKNYGPKIQKSLQQGNSPDQIGAYLTNNQSLSFGQKQEALSGMTEKEKAERILYRGDDVPSGLKQIPALAAAAGLGYIGARLGGNRGLPRTPATLLPALPNQPQQPQLPPPAQRLGLPAPQPPQLPPPAQRLGLPAPQQPQGPSPAPQQPQPQQPQGPQIPKISSDQILTQFGIKPNVDNLIQAGNNPFQIAKVADLIMKGDQKKQFKKLMDSGQISDLTSLITDYMTQNPPQQKVTQPKQEMQSPIQETPGEEKQLPREIQQPTQEIKPIEEEIEKEPEVGQTAAAPGGKLGQIESIKRGVATLNVDGKKVPVHLEDLELEPPEVVELVHNLLKIPEKDRSRLISFFGYDPNRQELFVQFHTGDLYSYFDVPEEQIKDLIESKGTPKTSGKDQYGAHIAGIPDSRGAALIENIIKDPRFGKQNKDKTYRKVDLLYDYWEKLRRKPKKPRKPKSP